VLLKEIRFHVVGDSQTSTLLPPAGLGSIDLSRPAAAVAKIEVELGRSFSAQFWSYRSSAPPSGSANGHAQLFSFNDKTAAYVTAEDGSTYFSFATSSLPEEDERVHVAVDGDGDVGKWCHWSLVLDIDADKISVFKFGLLQGSAHISSSNAAKTAGTVWLGNIHSSQQRTTVCPASEVSYFSAVQPRSCPSSTGGGLIQDCSSCDLVCGELCISERGATDGLTDLVNCANSTVYMASCLAPSYSLFTDLRLWDRALTCVESAVTEYWLPPPADAPGLKSWFRFESGSLTSAAGGVGGNMTMEIRNLMSRTVSPDPGSFVSTAMPITAALECRFRNVIVFTDPLKTFTATAPSASFSDEDCVNMQQKISVEYAFRDDFKDNIRSQCVYANGRLLQSYGAGNNGPGPGGTYTVSIGANKTIDIGSSPYLLSKTVYLAQQLPENACPTTIVAGNKTFAVTQIANTNQLEVRRTDEDAGWGEDLQLVCNMPGARQTFCVQASLAGTDLGYTCVTGLFYDGGPMDLRPRISKYGITFSFTDTSVHEDSFEIVRADSVNTINEGSIVVKVPYKLQGCGRDFSAITFSDQDAAQHPGLVFVYGVRARNEEKGYSTAQAVNAYRVPFMARLTIKVKTDSQVGVSEVEVEACHYAPDASGKLVKGNRCWRGGTDVHGQIDFDIEVADAEWTSLTQYFHVRPIPHPLTPVCHRSGHASLAPAGDAENPPPMSKYEPMNMTVAVDHFMENALDFTDKSSSLITGEVIFVGNLVEGARCPVANATVTVVKSGTEESYTTDSEGRFSFSAQNSEVVEVTVSYNRHIFQEPKQSFVMGSTGLAMTFFDITTEQLDLVLSDESGSEQYTTDSLRWEVSTAVCTPTLTFEFTGVVSALVPAMPFAIKIAAAPAVSLDRMDQGEAAAHNLCAEEMSVPIIEFFRELGNLDRAVDLRDEPASLVYTYRTGMCLITSQLFRLPPTSADTCDTPNNNYISVQQGQRMPIYLQMFEQFQTDSMVVPIPVVGTVRLREEISGDDSTCSPTKGIVEACMYPFDSNITMKLTVGVPTPSNNHLRPLTLDITRSPYNFDCPDYGCDTASLAEKLETIKIERWVPVTGDMTFGGADAPPKVFTVHSLCTHYALTMHSLCTHYALTMHSLCTHYALTMHPPRYSQCPPYSLYTILTIHHTHCTSQGIHSAHPRAARVQRPPRPPRRTVLGILVQVAADGYGCYPGGRRCQ
jgi:hypothetical protein